MSLCTICQGEFDLDAEGGIEGFMGILPVAFCPTCKACVADFGAQMDLSRESFRDDVASVAGDLRALADKLQDLVDDFDA